MDDSNAIKREAYATITIHNLDGELAESLRVAVARYGNSIEEEACYILRQTLHQVQSQKGFGSWVHQRFSQIDGIELELPDRYESPSAANK